ncbi:MAG: PEP-CTERM sorting domain-containing protein [Cyanobacteriota bacterium]|jgi:uncharacterized repeat protein (TIGR03803 family)
MNSLPIPEKTAMSCRRPFRFKSLLLRTVLSLVGAVLLGDANTVFAQSQPVSAQMASAKLSLIAPDPENPDLVDEDWISWPTPWMTEPVYFSYDPIAKTFNTFNDPANLPLSWFATAGADGSYYGIEPFGGAEGMGSIFTLDPETRTQTEIASFSGFYDQTGFPFAPFPSSLTLGNDGKLYGSTQYGGEQNGGLVFALDPTTNQLDFLVDFDGAYDAEYDYHYSHLPSALTLGNDSLLYGTTLFGGDKGSGSIFTFNPQDNSLTTLASFEGYTDEYGYTYSWLPSALVLGDNDLFYGTTAYGGEFGAGSLITFNPEDNSLRTVFSFESQPDEWGYAPSLYPSSLIAGADDLLCGTTASGGEFGAGALFCFNTSTNSLSTEVSFSPITTAEGWEIMPRANGLTLGEDGLLYGSLWDGAMYYYLRSDINPVASVPEPLTFLGAGIAIALGARFKRRVSRR